MISSGFPNLVRLLSVLCLFNIIFVVYAAPDVRRYPPATNNQRSAESAYKYAWFTRDIHDDDSINDEENRFQEEDLSPQRLLRMKILKSVFNRKYPNGDES